MRSVRVTTYYINIYTNIYTFLDRMYVIFACLNLYCVDYRLYILDYFRKKNTLTQNLIECQQSTAFFVASTESRQNVIGMSVHF